ncbi:acyl-ACP--UDP-N-acetylglucosamine O-acyltransferase [Candidatus Foliamicus sp.]
MTKIHATAIVSQRAELAASVEVEPYAVIGAGVKIGEDCRIGAHVVLEGPTSMGARNVIHPHAAIGRAPQDRKFREGEASRLEIGNDNTIREFVTINRGTEQGGGVTRVGNDCWLMASVHIAHDCILGDDVVMANFASVAGHVHVGNHVTLAGFSGAHQFCRLGAYSFIGIYSGVTRDVPPYVLVAGQPPKPRGVNVIGLRRHGFSAEQRANVERAYRTLYRKELSRADATQAIAKAAEEQPELALLAEFLAEPGRGLLR